MRRVVLGGGIAGVCCAEELCRLLPDDDVTIVSASAVLKGVENVVHLTRNIEEFLVVERDLHTLPYKNLRVVQGTAKSLDTQAKVLALASGENVSYDQLCICVGARPKVLGSSDYVLTLRDTQSVEDLCTRLAGARRVVVVGNGGIALETIQGLGGMEVIWVLKHGHIGDAFFDIDAAQFLLDELRKGRSGQQGSCIGKQMSEDDQDAGKGRGAPEQERPVQGPGPAAGSARQGWPRVPHGHAVGPKWTSALPSRAAAPQVTLEPNAIVGSIRQPADARSPWPVEVELTSGRSYGADLVVCAIGVEPVTDWLPAEIERAGDGGLVVDREMRTSADGVWAAGDVCSAGWAAEESQQWFQMRLWTQARVMGAYAGRCMAGMADELQCGFNFELFTHVTRFFGKKVILLGLYNGQKLEGERKEDLIAYSRATEGDDSSFVRVVLLRGRMQGAVLIGDTGLEEAFENVILDGIDLSQFGPRILDPDIEFDHIFD
ncbi:unnamed protein product [Ostreobium quekettii]|uniref:FAD/NAD(P)-binding domain-containing protein n=1 Tax=Ostreobium quekettii TaxID=121088 RepID=A0A8S1IQ97_9CHLO|nr:unnamed protein product [Ostreobium quekettii]